MSEPTSVPAAGFIGGVGESNPGALSNVSATQGGVLIGGDPTPRFSAVPTPPVTQTAPPVVGRYSDDDLARVRQQEKDKLYPQIEDLKNRLAAYDKERGDKAAVEAAERAAAEEAARKKAEDETDVRTLLQQKEAEWEQRLAEEKVQREQAFALLVREREFQELSEYRQGRISAEAESIMPELLDMVTGNTQDEIEASIAGLKERTQRILDSVQQATNAARQSMPGTRVTVPASGPLDTTSDQQTLTPEQIANMSYSDYVKNRSKLLGQASSRSGAFGLFG